MATLDNDDKKWLKENFITKGDAKNFSTKDDILKLEKGQKKIQKGLKIVIKSFDTEYLGLKKRVVKIESHLGIQPPEF